MTKPDRLFDVLSMSGGDVAVAHRPIHYLGSKLRLASDISALVQRLNPSRGCVVDLFSGSGVVSSVLGQTQPVVAVDIQEYARVLASALLRPCSIPTELFDSFSVPADKDSLGRRLLGAWDPLILAERGALECAAAGDPEPLAALLETFPLVAFQIDGPGIVPEHLRDAFREVLRRLFELGMDASVDSVITRYFGGLYFGIDQAIQLDVLAHRVSQVAPEAHDTVMSALLSTASAVVGTVGKQFAQPLRPRDRHGAPKPGIWRRVARDRSMDAIEIFRTNLASLADRRPAWSPSLAIRADYRDFLRSWERPWSLVYADPPYTRDHYSRFYHVLETISMRDQPELSRSNLNGRRSVSRGVYRSERHQSPFSICSKAPGAFLDLFRLTRQREAPLVLSYSPQLAMGESRPRVLDASDLQEMAGEFFANVRRVDVAGVTHSKLTRVDMHLSAPETAEFLLVCIP